ncbi:MAG: hypothetical protein V1878_02250 [bacterium]
MAAIRVMAFVALIALVGMAIVGDAVAGEKVKGRTAFYTVKWETVNVPEEEGLLMALAESRGITSNKEGKTFADGWVSRSVGLLDINVKTGLGSGHWYEEVTDRDGDKLYYRSEGKRMKGKLWASYWEGEYTIVRGTGKWEGIKGRGNWSMYPTAPMQSYTDWEMEVELPKR